jgi:glycosyltransferase involved in cell wall biosynthesis
MMAGPKVTFALVSYEHEAFVREAVRSALEQEYSPLEILVSDDCSGDGTFAILEEELAKYSGPHTVRVNRNTENLGSVEHFNRVVNMARGDFVVMGHGDDVSMPGRTRRLVETWTEKRVSLVSSNAAMIDAEGKPMGLLNEAGGDHAIALEAIIDQGWQKTMLGSAFACHKELLAEFPPIDPLRLPVGLDHVLPFRAALVGGMYYLGEPLIEWRQHAGNMGDRVADKTGSRLVVAETYDAFVVTARICMLEDLADFRRRGHDSPRLRAAQQSLANRILSDVRYWTGRRNELIVSGQRPTWVDKVDLEAKPVSHRITPRTPKASSGGRRSKKSS